MLRASCLTLALGALVSSLAPAEEPPSAEKGRQALLTKTYTPPSMTLKAYENAWQQWGLKEKPAPKVYARLYRERYGLHPAPYPNQGYPMGLKVASLFGFTKGLAVDCLICHGGSIGGKSYIGLGNASLDYQAFHEEMARADGRPSHTPFRFSNVRGTSEAGGMAVFLLGYREPNLNVRTKWLDLDLHDDMCEDPPAWWLLKKKKTMYHTGGADTRSVRSLMQFMMSPLNFPSTIKEAEGDFVHIRDYLLSLEAPQYPLPIDHTLANRGKQLFNRTCSRCHGTYGEKWTYPNRIVPIDEIGTDRRRYEGLTQKFGDYYNKSWFGEKYQGIRTLGYQAPPLDGIWATAPYFHNGSAPTVYHVLNSKARPRIFTRSYRTEMKDYDSKKLGWKITVLDRAPDPRTMPPIEFRKIYDTTQSGRSNTGHPFGDRFTDEERMAVIEYLKTL
jgi:hypothetical protein